MCKPIQCKETEVGYKMHVLTGVVSQACNHRQLPPLARQLILHSPFSNLKYHFLDCSSRFRNPHLLDYNGKSNTCLFMKKVGPPGYLERDFLKKTFKCNAY